MVFQTLEKIASDAFQDELEKLGKVLSTRGRAHVAAKNFVFPEAKKYPIHDISHARNALSRVASSGSESQKAAVRAAVYKKYPSLKK